MVILRPEVHVRICIEYVCGVRLPSAIHDNVTDLRSHCWLARLGRIPCAHLAGSADGMTLVKDQVTPLEILFSYVPQKVLDHQIHVERDQDSSPQGLLMELRWDVQPVRC